MKKTVLWVDQPLLLATVILMGLGFVMVFSASAPIAAEQYGSPYLFFRRQLAWDLLGLLSLWGLARLDYHRLQSLARPLFLFSLVGLVAVLLFGREISGARRWLRFGPIGVQPSELAKLMTIVLLADFLDRKKSALKRFWRGFAPSLLALGLVAVMILLEPDFGTSMLISAVGLTLLFLAGVRWMHLAGLLLASAPFVYDLVFTVPYRRRRLMAFLNPWADPQGAGYQMVQSFLALGSGGLWGKGLGQSTLKQLSLPQPHTDFIFPIIGEEMGFMGAMAVLTLFGLWGLRAWRVARRAPDLFGQLLGAGIVCWILYQALFNVAVAVGLLPTKGLPLPFVSFGGSSVVMTLSAVGILLNISHQSQMQKIQTLRKSKT